MGLLGTLRVIFTFLFMMALATRDWCLRTMKLKRSQNKFLLKVLEPMRTEISQDQLTILAGSIPAGLNGQYIRNGPNPQFAPMEPYHFFDGDGMLHGVHLQGPQSASYINRYVRTEKYEVERRFGKAMFPSYVGWIVSERAWLVRFIIDGIYHRITKTPANGKSANTSVVYHDRRVLALVEADAPTHIVAPNLETLGRYDYDGNLTHNFTAHPKVDPVTGEMFLYGYDLMKRSGPWINTSSVSADGAMTKLMDVPTEKPIMVHDFAITEHYTVLMDLPMTFDVSRTFGARQPPMSFDITRPGRIGVFPRKCRNPEEIVWFDIPGCMVFHIMNAWEDGDHVMLLACRSRVPNTAVFETPGYTGKDFETHLYEWRLNLKTRQSTERSLDTRCVEFPIINPSFTGRPIRYGYCSIMGDDGRPDLIGMVKYDLKTGQATERMFPAGVFGSEFSFVARSGATSEDDGYLMGFITDLNTTSSEFWILPAHDPSATPLVRIAMPQRVPMGFHGTWITEEQIRTQRGVTLR